MQQEVLTTTQELNNAKQMLHNEVTYPSETRPDYYPFNQQFLDVYYEIRLGKL